MEGQNFLQISENKTSIDAWNAQKKQKGKIVNEPPRKNLEIDSYKPVTDLITVTLCVFYIYEITNDFL